MKTAFINLLPEMNGPEWYCISPYAEAAPLFERVESGDADKTGGMLVQISNGKRNCFGRWVVPVKGVEGGKTYQFSVSCQVSGVRDAKTNLHVMLSWRGADEKDIQRDYVPASFTKDGVFFERVLPAPEGSVSMLAELCFKWSETGQVKWSGGSLFETDPIETRKCRVAAAFTTLPGGKETNLKAVLDVIDKAAESKPDILCLGETVLTVGTDFFESAVTLDGPEVAALGGKANQYSMYIVIGLNLFEDGFYRNVALLLDRAGKVAGIYRKIQLPLAEAEMGYTPGDESVVFDTDFGKIGVLICWDQGFPEATRKLYENGAEILFIPTMWNGMDIVAPARARDHGIFVVCSAPRHSGDPCFVINPLGEVIASCEGGEDNEFGYTWADIELTRQYKTYWFSIGPADGENRTVLAVERRSDLYDNRNASQPM